METDGKSVANYFGLDNRYDDPDRLLKDVFAAAAKTDTFMYRGASHHSEKYPSIMRVRSDKGTTNLYRHEIEMLKEFQKYGASLIEGNAGAIELVSCAQHFGVPTRLLDWTTDPFVALFFALSTSSVYTGLYNKEYRFFCLRYQQANGFRRNILPADGS